MIHIIDYGLGNVQAFQTVYNRLGINTVRAKTTADLQHAKKIILPGVGAFDHAMDLLNQSGMRPTLEQLVLKDKVPVLGICVGMQILANSSEEGKQPGLGWIPGTVTSFKSHAQSAALPMPHMGWNDITPHPKQPLFKGLETDARFYFLHSYFYAPKDPQHLSAVTSYGLDFGCAVSADTIHGVQFHPEKSHHFGTTLLKNFAEL